MKLRRRRLLPLAVVLGFSALPAPAAAEPVPGTEATPDAAFTAEPRPTIAFLRGRDLHIVARGTAAWSSARVARVPDADGRVAALTAGAALVESRRGTWLRVYLRRAGSAGWRVVRIADAPKDAVLGAAGMTLTRRARPIVAYSLRRRDQTTELWLAEVGANARVVRTRVTRRGFPPSSVPPAAFPVRMPNGTIRVVQTFAGRGAAAIFWRRERDRWWGRVLFASALGAAAGPLFPALVGDSLFLAWSVAYPEQQELHVVLTSRAERSTSIVVHRNAAAAGLVLGPNGPEVAANTSVGALHAGLIAFPTIVNGAIRYSPPIELDGRIVGYAGDGAGRQLLLVRNGRLEWFAAGEPPHVRIFHEGGLSGHIEGAAGGTVRVYRERAAEPRVVVADAPVGVDGRFTAIDPAPLSGWNYRFVYEADLPYALLLPAPVP